MSLFKRGTERGKEGPVAQLREAISAKYQERVESLLQKQIIMLKLIVDPSISKSHPYAFFALENTFSCTF